MRILICHYLKALAGLTGSVVAAWIVVTAMRRRGTKVLSAKLKLLIMGSATALFFLAGVGGVGWAIQTWAGDSPAESLNGILMFWFSVVATWMIFIDLFFTYHTEKGGNRDNNRQGT